MTAQATMIFWNILKFLTDCFNMEMHHRVAFFKGNIESVPTRHFALGHKNSKKRRILHRYQFFPGSKQNEKVFFTDSRELITSNTAI